MAEMAVVRNEVDDVDESSHMYLLKDSQLLSIDL